MTGVNTLHRRHWKSGSCLTQRPLEEYVPRGKRFFRLMEFARDLGSERRREREIEKMLRPRRQAVDSTPRSTQSLFGRVKSKLLGLFGRKAA